MPGWPPAFVFLRKRVIRRGLAAFHEWQEGALTPSVGRAKLRQLGELYSICAESGHFTVARGAMGFARPRVRQERVPQKAHESARTQAWSNLRQPTLSTCNLREATNLSPTARDDSPSEAGPSDTMHITHQTARENADS